MAYDIISTVVTPAQAAEGAGAYDLIDLASVKDEMTLKDGASDDYLARAISQISARLANACNRVFVLETIQDVIYPRQDAYPYQVPGTLDGIQLSRWPVASVVSVIQSVSASATNTLVANTDYRLDAKRGQLVRLNSFTGSPMAWESLPLTVIYRGGYDPIPDDLREAATRMVLTRFKGRERDPALRSRSTGDIGNQSFWLGMPPDVQETIDNYRVPVTA